MRLLVEALIPTDPFDLFLLSTIRLDPLPFLFFPLEEANHRDMTDSPS